MKRRTLLKGGLGLGAVGAVGLFGRYGLLAPPASTSVAPVDELAAEVYAALPEEARAAACVPFDHPLRQYYNRGLAAGGLAVNAASLPWRTRRLVTDLMHAGLSEPGRARIPQQDITRWGGVNFMRLLFCGEPISGPYTAVLSGVHLNLRLGGRNPEGVAFGGPQVYGDQRGNGVGGLPGNTYRYQLEAAQRLLTAMTKAQRATARVERAPAQTLIGLQGSNARFDGIPIAELDADARGLARALVATILGTYADRDAAYAWQCLEHNGGVDALHFADYDVDFQGGRHAGEAPSQIFRLEGPAAVLHFRGEPHVHAFAHVAMDADRPLGVGARLGDNPAPLEGEALRRFFETAMRVQAQADAAVYPLGGVVGRLPAGEVRTGDVWVAESWVDELAVVEVEGRDLAEPARAALRARGHVAQAGSVYRLAATGYLARYEAPEHLGRVRRRESLGLLRDALTAYAKAHGFPAG